MSAQRYNAVEWFEVGTDRPEDVKKFYGELFGWTFTGAGQYSEITTPGSDHVSGGVFDSQGAFPSYAIFYVTVEDVAATLSKAEALGAKVLVPATTSPDGLVFAQLQDATGNHFGIFTPPQKA
ncbi:VOC family protein [Actinomadura sp. DC4]|uniref:VOC family protein n=1 Tax=Actinomadura sp. DC4 TaxID=3055069 RepID=UPI0025AF8980|nr:VOC family protein [Actinomadura sp. DC4]MDN3354953.1 VOC family protein [Actinomadura sp. DC4]